VGQSLDNQVLRSWLSSSTVPPTMLLRGLSNPGKPPVTDLLSSSLIDGPRRLAVSTEMSVSLPENVIAAADRSQRLRKRVVHIRSEASSQAMNAAVNT
jgi:hypothetical protein